MSKVLTAPSNRTGYELASIASEYPFEPQRFEHEGIQQTYVDVGDPQADPILFVHGNPTWSFFWRRPIRHLSERFRCVAPDHIGCGLSDKPQAFRYTLENHIDRLERLVLSLDLSGITLVVHDWGGPIGLGFARRHPERIARIAVLNTAAFRSTRIPLRIAACRVPLLGRFAVQGFNAFARAATFMAVERPLRPEVRRGYLLPYDSYSHRIATHAFVLDIPLKAGHRSFEELERIEASLDRWADVPKAILWGEKDWCFTPWFRSEWERRWPEARVWRFERAGHYLTEDEPHGVLRALDELLLTSPGNR